MLPTILVALSIAWVCLFFIALHENNEGLWFVIFVSAAFLIFVGWGLFGHVSPFETRSKMVTNFEVAKASTYAVICSPELPNAQIMIQDVATYNRLESITNIYKIEIVNMYGGQINQYLSLTPVK